VIFVDQATDARLSSDAVPGERALLLKGHRLGHAVGTYVVASPPGLSKVESIAVRSGIPGSYWEIIARGSLRGRMVLACACLSLSQLV